ncbi:hypothetical protein CDD83_7596 [Cordyceps sp. RAO-2017]|nr:hypothetical protein CDD83_7596 [Cordyceps sp. RAO-2017]
MFKVAGLAAPIDGYEVFIPQWEVEVAPGGRTTKLNGTVQQVYRELLLMNPRYDEDFAVRKPARSAANATSSTQGTDWNLGSSICGRWQPTSVQHVREGIGYLRKVRGQPGSEPGPSRCGRVSCAYNSAIWWCNDDERPKSLSAFEDIANGAQLLVTRCVEWMNPPPSEFGGQAFHPSRWNVIIRGDSC